MLIHAEDSFKAPQDVEWTYDRDSLVLLQSRPITLINHYVRKYSSPPTAVELLCRRELENVLMQGILYSATGEICLGDVDLSRNKQANSQITAAFQNLPYKAAKELTLKDFNYNYINFLLQANSGNITRAARQCGLERQALQQIMRRYEIKADGFRR